jgi:hypothetical protein
MKKSHLRQLESHYDLPAPEIQRIDTASILTTSNQRAISLEKKGYHFSRWQLQLQIISSVYPITNQKQ